MEGPFTNSISTAEKCKTLQDVVSSEDTVAILINAGPDAIASAFALKRMLGHIGSAGGHKSMARAEVHLEQIKPNGKNATDLEQYVLNRLKRVVGN